MRNIAGSAQSVHQNGEKIASRALPFESHDDSAEPAFKPLTRAEAEQLRQNSQAISPWQVLAGQFAVGLVVAIAAALLMRQPGVGWSVLYGALAVVVPGAIFARGLKSKLAKMNPGAAVAGFFLWEMVKIGLTVAMLFAAPRLIADLSWPAMLVGLIVTMKAVWLVLWLHARSTSSNRQVSNKRVD
jgi:ATP synthase protein I